MKSQLTTFISILVIMSCNKDTYKPDYSFGKLSIERNGKNYSFESNYNLFPSKDSFSINNKFIDEYNNRELIYISLMPYPPNYKRYSLQRYDYNKPFNTGLGKITDGDQVEVSYSLLEDSTVSNIEFTKVDTVTGWVEGKLNAVFIKDVDFKEKKQFEDTITFKNGTFRTRRKY